MSGFDAAYKCITQFCMFLLFYVAGVCLAYRWFSYLGRSKSEHGVTGGVLSGCNAVICRHLYPNKMHIIYTVFFLNKTNSYANYGQMTPF